MAEVSMTQVSAYSTRFFFLMPMQGLTRDILFLSEDTLSVAVCLLEKWHTSQCGFYVYTGMTLKS